MLLGQEEKRARATRYLAQNEQLRSILAIPCNAPVELQFLGNGEHNENFYFAHPDTGKKYVLRINVQSQPFHKDQVSYEYAALKALEPSLCTPKALYCDNSKQLIDQGVLLLEFCEGEELNFDRLQPGSLRCAVQMMANIHAVAVPENCGLFRPKDPLQALFDECIERFEVYHASAYEDAALSARVDRFIAYTQKAMQAPVDARDCTHIINTETLPSHFLIPEASAQAAANNLAPAGAFCAAPGTFVDWERPIIGEVAQDLAFFVSPATTFWDSDYLFPKQDIESLLADYWRAVDGRFEAGHFEARFWAYFKVSVLRAVAWCCKALLRYGKNGVGYTTQKTVAKLPVYLSDDFLDYLEQECFLA